MSELEKGRILTGIARAAIADALNGSRTPLPQDAWLWEFGACFVTLTQYGKLRGCIGSLEAYRPLAEDVYHNALAAAFHDPRFAPLQRHELDQTRCEISLLSATETLSFGDEQDALAQLRPGVDGIIFQYGHHRSTFLPQVWEQLPQPRDFMAHLKRKAGLPDDFWAAGIRLSRYTVAKYREEESRDG